MNKIFFYLYKTEKKRKIHNYLYITGNKLYLLVILCFGLNSLASVKTLKSIFKKSYYFQERVKA